MKRSVLIFRDDRAALAVSVTPEEVTLVAFEGGRKLTLGVQQVPAGLIQFVAAPHRTIRLGLYVVNGEQVALLFGERQQYGYAVNLSMPEHSEWGEAPDEVIGASLEGKLIASWRDRSPDAGVEAT